MNDFDSIDPIAFYEELISSVAVFLGLNKTEVFRTLSDLLFSLHGVLKMLSRHSEEPQSAEYQSALRSLETLCVNLKTATHLEGLVKQLKSAGNYDQRMGVVEELMVMVKFCHDNLGRGRR